MEEESDVIVHSCVLVEARGRGDEPIRLAITGSGGLALADNLHVPFEIGRASCRERVSSPV